MDGFFRQNCVLCTELRAKMWAMRLLRSGDDSFILFIKVNETVGS